MLLIQLKLLLIKFSFESLVVIQEVFFSIENVGIRADLIYFLRKKLHVLTKFGLLRAISQPIFKKVTSSFSFNLLHYTLNLCLFEFYVFTK